MTIKWFFVLLLPLLLGFSTSDNVKYVVEYNHNEIAAEKLYKQIESYAIAQGFVLNRQIKEEIPKKRLFSELQIGKPFRGGIILVLTLDEDTNLIRVEATSYHGGCTKSDNIEKMDEFQDALQNHMQAQLSISVSLKAIKTTQ